jgi:hypothetical protein
MRDLSFVRLISPIEHTEHLLSVRVLAQCLNGVRLLIKTRDLGWGCGTVLLGFCLW